MSLAFLVFFYASDGEEATMPQFIDTTFQIATYELGGTSFAVRAFALVE